jgi:recombination protein RecT
MATALKERDPNLSASTRFTEQVMKEFTGANAGTELKLSDYQRYLIGGYFIGVDRALKQAEEARARKNEANNDHKYDNTVPVTWNNVNLAELALDVVYYARMGLDMMEKNHVFPIPYLNKKTGKYDVNLMPGYNGIQYMAEKYAVEKPAAVVVELVYSTDTFKAVKKSAASKVESYEFEINNAFDRGQIVGGFGYIEYTDPAKNKLVIMSRKDIEKRKPKYASGEFWGGKIKQWENKKQVEAETEGWYEEMCLKTLKREIYSPKHMPRDPQKVDEAYQHMMMREARRAAQEAQLEIDTYANRTPVIDAEVVDVPQREEPANAKAQPEPLREPKTESKPKADNRPAADQETGEVIAEPGTTNAPERGKEKLF